MNGQLATAGRDAPGSVPEWHGAHHAEAAPPDADCRAQGRLIPIKAEAGIVAITQAKTNVVALAMGHETAV